MKADVTPLNERSSSRIKVNAENKFHIKPELSTTLSTGKDAKGKKGIIIIPVAELNELQWQLIQELPGAYMLPTDIKLTDSNKKEAGQQEKVSEANFETERLRFLVKHSTKFLSITIDQIAYFYADNRLNFIRTWNNKTYIIDKTIEEISGILNKNDFFRINRSYIISYKSIEEVYAHFNNRLKLKLNIAVPEELFVSKDRVANFKEWLGA